VVEAKQKLPRVTLALKRYLAVETLLAIRTCHRKEEDEDGN
jgi:hypothetical protein